MLTTLNQIYSLHISKWYFFIAFGTSDNSRPLKIASKLSNIILRSFWSQRLPKKIHARGSGNQNPRPCMGGSCNTKVRNLREQCTSLVFKIRLGADIGPNLNDQWLQPVTYYGNTLKTRPDHQKLVITGQKKSSFSSVITHKKS